MSSHRKLDFKTLQYAGHEGKLIPALQKAQERDGFLSRERIQEIHRESGTPLAQIYGVATFYSQFRFHPVGKHIVRVCHGTACHVSGAKGITESLEENLGVSTGETTKDRLFTLDVVSCLGCCSLAPVITVGADTFGALDPTLARRTLRQHRREAATSGAGDDARTVRR